MFKAVSKLAMVVAVATLAVALSGAALARGGGGGHGGGGHGGHAVADMVAVTVDLAAVTPISTAGDMAADILPAPTISAAGKGALGMAGEASIRREPPRSVPAMSEVP